MSFEQLWDRIALVTAPVVIAGYVTGLGAGPSGVAAGFSITTFLSVARYCQMLCIEGGRILVEMID
jgi:hypothetical protein